MSRIKGIYKKPKTQEVPNFGDSIYSVVQQIQELHNTKNEVIDAIDNKIEEVDKSIEIKINEVDDSISKIDAKVEEVNNTLIEAERAAVQMISDIRSIPQLKGEDGVTPEKGVDYFDGAPGKDAVVDEESIASLVLKKIPENKPSLKIIQESIDPQIIIDKIANITDKKVLKIKANDILDLSAIVGTEISRSKPYLHGGGDTVVAGTNITITTNANGAKVISSTGGGSGITLKTNGTDNGSQTILNLQAGTGIALTDNGTGQVLVENTGASGDVVGPASSVDDNVVFFDGITGKLIKDSGLTLSGTNTGDQDLSGYELLSNKATDFTTLNNTLYPTTQAVSNFVTDAVIGLLDYRGSYDASIDLFPATGGSGIAGAILKSDFWICSVTGTLGGVIVTPGDLIIAIVDTPGQTAANWDLIAHDLGSYVTSVAGTADRITSTGGASPVIDIASTYIGQSSITTLGTITTGVWNGTPIGDSYLATSYLPLSGGTLTGALNGTSATFGGLVTGSSGFSVPNGQYYQAKRNTGGATINVLGFESGTDDLVQVFSANWKLRNTGTGDAANVIVANVDKRVMIAGATDNGTDALQVAGSANISTTAYVGSRLNIFGTSMPSVSNPRLLVTTNTADFVVAIQGNVSTGNSYGPIIQAGTNASDISLLIRDANNTTDYFKILGTGAATFAGDLTTTGVLYANKTASDTILAGEQYLSGGYNVFRTGTDRSFNIDTYNGGSSVNVLKITQAGVTTIAGAAIATNFSLSGRGTGFIYGMPDWRIYNNSSNQLIINNYTVDALTFSSSGNATFSNPLSVGTSNSITAGTLELGHASDTTISRVSAGVIAVEGVTIPSISSTSTITNKRNQPRVVSAASYTTDTGTSLDFSTCDLFIVTAQAGALKFNNPSGTPVQGEKMIIRIKDNGTARALTYDTQYRAIGVTLPTTTVISKTLYIAGFWNATDTKFDVTAVGQES